LNGPIAQAFSQVHVQLPNDRKPWRVAARVGLIALLFAATLAGCESKVAESGLPLTKLRLGSETFSLEIADNAHARERGLMYRESMPANHGMIFVFAEDAPRSFYMRNTQIALDIIYVNARQEVVSIKQMQPRDLTTVPSDAPARWAIELNEGTAGRVGVKVGDKLDIPPTAGGED